MPRGWTTKIVLGGVVKELCGGLREVNFGPNVNVLAGPNGSGKSTILRALRDRNWANEQGCEIWVEGEGNVDWVAFDAEQDNPRARGGTGPLQFLDHIGSHGQVQQRVWKFMDERVKPGMLVMLDEPEAAMDVDGVRRFFALVERRKDIQWIMASHHPLLWRLPNARIIELRSGHIARTMAVWREVLGG